jgi:hypothetical protein
VKPEKLALGVENPSPGGRMTAPQLLQGLRGLGVSFRVDGGRLLYGPLARVPVELREEISQHRDELLRLVHPDAYAELACSDLAHRVQDTWRWIADHRPDLFDRVMQADQGPEATDLPALEAALRACFVAFETARANAAQLKGQPQELVDATTRALSILGGKVVDWKPPPSHELVPVSEHVSFLYGPPPPRHRR